MRVFTGALYDRRSYLDETGQRHLQSLQSAEFLLGIRRFCWTSERLVKEDVDRSETGSKSLP
eukprot:222672-Hanusia_phi.AAC.1